MAKPKRKIWKWLDRSENARSMGSAIWNWLSPMLGGGMVTRVAKFLTDIAWFKSLLLGLITGSLIFISIALAIMQRRKERGQNEEDATNPKLNAEPSQTGIRAHPIPELKPPPIVTPPIEGVSGELIIEEADRRNKEFEMEAVITFIVFHERSQSWG